MAEGVESKHQHDKKKKAAAKHKHITAELSFFLDARLPFQKRRRLIDLGTDINNEESGQRADHKHPAPADVRKQSAVNQSGQQITDHVAFLQQSGEEAAAFFGQGFKRQSSAHTPLAAHRN